MESGSINEQSSDQCASVKQQLQFFLVVLLGLSRIRLDAGRNDFHHKRDFFRVIDKQQYTILQLFLVLFGFSWIGVDAGCHQYDQQRFIVEEQQL